MKRRSAVVRMHADGSSVQDGVKLLGPKCTARYCFRVYGSRQSACGNRAPSTDAHRRTGPNEGEGRGARRASGAENQHAAAGNAELPLKSGQHTRVIGVVSVQAAVFPDHDGIHGADLRRQRIAFRQMPYYRLLVWDGDAESTNAELRNRIQKVGKVVYQKRQVDSIHPLRGEPGIVQEGRERMSNRIADNAVNRGMPRQSVSPVQILEIV